MNPASFEAAAPASWFRMKLGALPRAPAHREHAHRAFHRAEAIERKGPNVNFSEGSSNRSRWRGLPCARGAPDLAAS